MEFDAAVYAIAASLHAPIINWLWIALAKYGIYIVVFLACVLFFKKKEVREKLLILFQTLLVLVLARGLVSETISFFFNVQRPFEVGKESLYTHGTGGSFPSGHTVTMFSIAFVLYNWNKKAGKYAFVIATLSGISRAIAGVHWISDIIGGFLIAWIVYLLLKKFVFSKKLSHIKDNEIIQKDA